MHLQVSPYSSISTCVEVVLDLCFVAAYGALFLIFCVMQGPGVGILLKDRQ